MKAAIVVFPGTNCDRDTKRACEYMGWNTEYIWHDCTELNAYDVVILPGGFSYGDYLRAGSLAAYSPIVKSLNYFKGVIVGICNGFQILCETGLLPGVLTFNESTRFICDEVKLQSNHSLLPNIIKLPIAHQEGRYYNPKNIDNEMILFRYKDNPNSSNQDIAGLYDKKNKIVALMPHPERAVFQELGNTDGRAFFEFIEGIVNETV